MSSAESGAAVEADEHSLIGAAADYLSKHLSEAADARTLVIAGSGLGGFVKALVPEAEIPYGDIPGIGESTVVGHAGRLLYARAGETNTPVLVMSGRRHIYEGLTAAEAVRLPRAIMAAFPGIGRLVLSNAAGGLDPLLSVGDLMLISDQVNWSFRNPLIGKNSEEHGPRFPDMCNVYSRRLRQLARSVALRQGTVLREGVYVAMQGPSYETRAEVAMLRHLIGADAVGMSTVPEAIAAAHAGREVLGISFISNTLTLPSVTSHAEVVENSRLVESRFSALLLGLLPELHALA